MAELKTRLYLFYNVFGVVLGISAGITFSIFHNNWAVFWAFLSAAYALMNTYLFYLEYREKLEDYYNIHVLENINCFAMISTIIFSGILLWYIFAILYYDLHVFPIKESYHIMFVWCLISMKCAAVLAASSKRQIQILRDSGVSLLQP